MMALGNLRAEEKIGLAVAVALHAALFGMFMLRSTISPVPVPQPISVTLSRDVGLNAAAPTHEDAAADQAPTLGAPPPTVAPAPVVTPQPAKIETPPVAKAIPQPKPVVMTKSRPIAIIRPQPEAEKPLKEAVATPRPAHKPAHPDKAVPSVKDWNLAAPATPDHQPAGGSRVGNDFLKGIAGGKASGKATQQGAAVIGPEVKSALSGAIAHQLKPRWMAPEGVDADKLVTILSWDLNADGTLAGPPHMVRQEGITDSNRPQAARHAEQAIRAVELAAPFKLPAEYYGVWKHVRSFEFNRTLSQ